MHRRKGKEGGKPGRNDMERKKGEYHGRNRWNPSCLSSWLSGFISFHFQLDHVKVSASLPAEQSDTKLLWQQEHPEETQPRGEEVRGGDALLHTRDVIQSKVMSIYKQLVKQLFNLVWIPDIASVAFKFGCNHNYNRAIGIAILK